MLNKPARRGAAFAPLPCAATGAADMGKRKTKETGGNAGRGAAKIPRPLWVEDLDAEMLGGNFAPSLYLYYCACAFVWAEAQRAYSSGDNSLLSRAGFADALEFIANPANAGNDTADYSEMLEDYRRLMDLKKLRAEYYKPAKMINAELPRVAFWQKFEAANNRDADAMKFRREFLTERLGGLLRFLLEIKESNADIYNALTDRLIFPQADTAANPDPASVRAFWLNNTFSDAGAELARWLSVAKLPNYEKELAALRERIAENFGVFPAPFECADADGGDICAPRYVVEMCATIHEKNGNAEKARKAREALKDLPARRYVRLASDELQTLVFIGRAQIRQREDDEIARARQAVEEMERTQKANGGAANPSGTADTVQLVKIVESVKVETPAPKKKPAGQSFGISQAAFAALLKHYGGRFDGKPYKKRAIKEWDAHAGKRPMAGGVIYSPDLRRDPIAARKWALDFNAESQARWNARKTGLRRY